MGVPPFPLLSSSSPPSLLSSFPLGSPWLPSHIPTVSLSVCLLRLIPSLFTGTGLELIPLPCRPSPFSFHPSIPSFSRCDQTALFIFPSFSLVCLFSFSKSKGTPAEVWRAKIRGCMGSLDYQTKKKKSLRYRMVEKGKMEVMEERRSEEEEEEGQEGGSRGCYLRHDEGRTRLSLMGRSRLL